jgi:hypothetical protein
MPTPSRPGTTTCTSMPMHTPTTVSLASELAGARAHKLAPRAAPLDAHLQSGVENDTRDAIRVQASANANDGGPPPPDAGVRPRLRAQPRHLRGRRRRVRPQLGRCYKTSFRGGESRSKSIGSQPQSVGWHTVYFRRPFRYRSPVGLQHHVLCKPRLPGTILACSVAEDVRAVEMWLASISTRFTLTAWTPDRISFSLVYGRLFVC